MHADIGPTKGSDVWKLRCVHVYVPRGRAERPQQCLSVCTTEHLCLHAVIRFSCGHCLSISAASLGMQAILCMPLVCVHMYFPLPPSTKTIKCISFGQSVMHMRVSKFIISTVAFPNIVNQYNEVMLPITGGTSLC